MNAHHPHDPAGVNTPVSRASEFDECAKLIRKLRWIGLEEDARQIEAALRACAPNARGVVLAEPASTD